MIEKEFNFDGRNSSEFGLSVVRMNTGLVSSPFTGSKNINEEASTTKRKPLFRGVEQQPLTFEVTFSLEDKAFTQERRYEIARWLCRNEYKEIWFSDMPSRVFKVIMTNQSDLMLDGSLKGYFTATFRADAGYGYTPIRISTFDSTSNGQLEFEVKNESNVMDVYKPEFTIIAKESGDFKIKNLSNEHKETIFYNIEENEEIYVDNFRKTLISSKYRFMLGSFNKQWLELVYGVNTIQVSGKMIIQFRNQFPVYL